MDSAPTSLNTKPIQPLPTPSAQQGSVLLIVLVFSCIAAMLVLTLLENDILQIKSTHTFQQERLNFIKTEQVLRQKQNRLLTQNLMLDPNPVEPAAFVPDTLDFAEREGVYYYETDIDMSFQNEAKTHLQSMVARR